MKHSEQNIGAEYLADKIDFMVKLIEGRKDGQKFMPVLKVLLDKYDEVVSVGDMMNRAKTLARQHKSKPSNTNNVVRLRA